jgi:DNA primase
VADHLREAMILAILLAHPTLLREAEASLERAEFRDPGHEALRHALLKASHEAPAEFVTAIRSEAPDALEKLLSLAHVRIAPPVRPDADPVLAAQVLARELRLLTANRSSNDEVIEAMIEMEGLADESITWRITRSNLERASLEKENLDGGSSEVEVADNGVAVRRDERVAFRSLTDGIVFEKKKQR